MSTKEYNRAHPRFTWEEVKAWEELHAQGMMYSEIAKELGVSDGYVRGKCSAYRRKIASENTNKVIEEAIQEVAGPFIPVSHSESADNNTKKEEKKAAADEDYTLIKKFWESLPQEFDTVKAILLGSELGISRPTIERYLRQWQDTKLEKLFRGQYKKKETVTKTEKKPSLSDFTPREIIQYMYSLGYRIDKDGLYQEQIIRNRVKLADII